MINGGTLSSTSLPALSNTTAATLCTVPPGVGSIIISNNCGSIAYIAAGVTASATAGFGIPNSTTVTIPMYPGSKGTTLSILTASAPTGPVSWLITTAQ
jgi:hypothetical protein